MKRRLATPHVVTLVVAWLVVVGVLGWMLFQGVRSTDRHGELRWMLQAGYVALLIWFLARTDPRGPRPAELRLPDWTHSRHGAWIPALGVMLLLALCLSSDDGFDIIMLLLILATVWILVAWGREIRARAVVQGLGLALIAYLVGHTIARNEFVSEGAVRLLAGLSAPMYVAGGLLLGRARVGGVQILAGRYLAAVKSVAWGALLFAPLGLANAADGSPSGDTGWVTEWWMPMALPSYSAITEEIWFRLLLVGISVFLLRPAFREAPEQAVAVAVLFAGITFGLGHERTLDGFMTTGLLYGVPMAAVSVRRDWEHAVGAHYMVNMIPWLMTYLEN